MRQMLFATVVTFAFALPAAADPMAAGTVVVPPSAPPAGEDVGFRGCGTHAAVTRWLAGNFAEKPLARGVQGDGQLLEIYIAKEGSTWTVVVTDPSGASCIVTEGTSFELLPQEVGGPVA